MKSSDKRSEKSCRAGDFGVETASYACFDRVARY